MSDETQDPKTRAEFAAMRRASLAGFARHAPAYSAEELAALARGEGAELYTTEELDHLLNRAPPARPGTEPERGPRQ